MNRTLRLLTVLAATTLAAPAVTVLLDSKDHASVVTTGSQATFGAQSFILSVAGSGTSDTVTTNSPLPATGTLNSITFVRAPTGTATVGSLFLKLYTTSADAAGTPLAVSTNGIDVNSATFLANLVWNFSGETLSTTTTYFAVFSTNGLADPTGTDLVGARIAAANFGGGFVSTAYGGADASLRGFSALNPPAGTNLDARFTVSFDVVPEPSAALLGAIGVLALLRRRRE
ncbi:hypothetical protein [Luteolibacter sp. Populi]|uniref:hypothetical protein n=1 Tax=Luteolibacter sp. Populi TaxID=3230487 RepID=UPI0034655030